MRAWGLAVSTCSALLFPHVVSACAQLSAHVWMCDRGTVWEDATWDTVGDGSTRYLGEAILNFTEEWPGFDITDSVATLEEQFETYNAYVAADGGPAPQVLQVDKIVTRDGLTLRHLQYDEIEGDRTMSAVMLSEVGNARIMLYLDTKDQTPLAEMEKMSFEVAMTLRSSCADTVSCAGQIDPHAPNTE